MKEFDQNEWFVIINVIIELIILCVMPKRFPISLILLMFLFSVSLASMFDFLIGGYAIDFYDILDGPKYELVEVLVYLMYAPFGYWFIYMLDLMQLKGRMLFLYIMGCSLIGIGYEWITVVFGVFIYKNGYFILYSYPIYLFSQSLYLLFYRYVITDTRLLNTD